MYNIYNDFQALIMHTVTKKAKFVANKTSPFMLVSNKLSVTSKNISNIDPEIFITGSPIQQIIKENSNEERLQIESFLSRHRILINILKRKRFLSGSAKNYSPFDDGI
jgi:hypothetical protein